MKIEARMSTDDMFEVLNWWARSPDCVIESLAKQLKAAQAIWPELEDYVLVKKPDSQL